MQMRTDAYPGQRRQSGPPQHNRDRKPQIVRTTRAVNLGKLAEACELDVLSAALGVNEHSLRALIDGREQFKDSPQGMHVSIRLEDAGVPSSWLENAISKVDPTQVTALRKLAAQSERKAPIRKSNFKKLVAAFEGRKGLLADALEVVEASIDNILSGRNELDDERFWHINPRLMDAGFPNRWLEDPDAELTEDLVLGLEEIAADELERFFDDDDDELPQAVVSAPAPPAAGPAATASADRVAATQKEPSSAKAPSTEKETSMAITDTNQEKQAVTLPRGALAAGRRIAGAAPVSKPIQVTTAPAPSPEPTSVGAPTLVPNKMPTLHMPAKTETASAPASAAVQSPVATLEPASQNGVAVMVKKRRVLEKPETPPTSTTQSGAAPDETTPKRKGRPVSISKEKSFARFKALNELLTSLPRGAKTEFWDKMGRSLQYAGNLRTGATMFRDELAQQAEATLGVTPGWLDAPTPVTQFSPWLTEFIQNAAGTAPSAQEAPAAAPVQAKRAPQPEPAPAPVMAPAVPAAEPAPVVQKVAQAPEEAAPRPSVKPFARKAAKPAMEVHYAPEPEAVQVAAPMGAFAWSPAVEAQASAQSGPMTQALCAVLNQLSKDGTFTEQDAMRMLQFLLAR